MTAIRPFNEFKNYNEYAAHIHELNAHWWQNADGTPKELDKGERFMLMVSELSEAMEGHRKNLKDDKLPEFPMLYVELADTIIRVMDSGHKYGWDMDARPRGHTSDLYQLDINAKIPEGGLTVGSELFNIVDYINQLAFYVRARYARPQISQLAATIIDRCLALARKQGCKNIWHIVHMKLIFNSTRSDHQWANRMAPGGKAY